MKNSSGDQQMRGLLVCLKNYKRVNTAEKKKLNHRSVEMISLVQSLYYDFTW